MNKRMWWTWVVLVSVTLAGCGGDDSGDDDAPAGGVGGAAGVAAVGGSTAGVGGMSGAGGSGGSGGTTAPMPVTCGTTTCPDPFGGMMLPIPLPKPCCANEAMGTCGTMPAAGGACMPPIPADPRCPTVMGPLPTTSCCTADNLCGLDGSMFGRGCVDFAMIASGPLGAVLMVPAPVTCDGMPVGGDEDAGI
jgi:hypothetical protein